MTAVGRYFAVILFAAAGAFYPALSGAGFIKRGIVKKFTPKASLPAITTDPDKSDVAIAEDPKEQCKATVMPSFINHSMTWEPNKYTNNPIHKGLKSVSPPSIHVVAAGNKHPKPVNKVKRKAARDLGAILVGALGSSGRRAPYSSQGEEVHIMAPSADSDSRLTSANDDGRYRSFGGTSGATPLVTGSLAGFEWLAGYHPTAAEAKTLLEKTAIKTPYSDDKPRKNGVGMVNAYKLAMVGKRLKAMCGKSLACFKKKIQDKNTYKFPQDEGLDKEVNRAFPQCSRTACGSSNVNNPPSCLDKDAVFERLRKAAFLNPQNKKLWRQIACIYTDGGFHKNSEGAMSIYRSLSGPYAKSSRHCKQDSDCALVPRCGSDLISISLPAKSSLPTKVQQRSIAPPPQHKIFTASNLIGAEEHYLRCMQKQGGNVLCNNKCRCGSKEKIVSKGAGVDFTTTYRSRCVKSLCTLSVEKGQQSIPILISDPAPGAADVAAPGAAADVAAPGLEGGNYETKGRR